MSSCNDKVHKVTYYFLLRMSLLILYGSETGTAQDVGESLRREALMRNLTVRLISMDEYDLHVVSKFLITVKAHLKISRVYPTKKQFCLFALQLVKVKCPRICGHFGGRCFEKVSPTIFLLM